MTLLDDPILTHPPEPSADVERDPTPEEMARLSDEAGVEYMDGVLIEHLMSRSSVKVGTRIARLLGNADPQELIVEVYSDGLAYRCFPGKPRLFRKPDVSVISKRRLREANIASDVGIMPIPPDLAVEVISPGDSAYNVRRKFEEYREAGFGQVWLVYPEVPAVFVWRRDGTVQDLAASDVITVGELLPAFRCTVAELVGPIAEPVPQQTPG